MPRDVAGCSDWQEAGFAHDAAQPRCRVACLSRACAAPRAGLKWPSCRARHRGRYTDNRTMPTVRSQSRCLRTDPAWFLGIVLLLPVVEGETRMIQVSDRLWTLAREPAGPLVRYLDPFAASLAAEGFKRMCIDQKIRLVAGFSRWLQSEGIPVEAVSDEHVRVFLRSLTPLRVARSGSAATLWRLVNFLRCQGICSASRDPGKITEIQQIVAQFAEYLRESQGLAAGTLTHYCSFAESFLSEETLSSSSDERRLALLRQGPRQQRPPYGLSCGTFAIVAGHSMTWRVLYRPCQIGQ
jgi:hypothetical protein